MKILITLLALSGMCLQQVFGQAPLRPDTTIADTLPVNDLLLKTADLSNARPFAYPKMNSANIRIYAELWRDIDLADSANANLAIPGKSLMETIMKGLSTGKLTAFEKEDFKKKISSKQSALRFADTVLIPIFDKDGNQTGSRTALNEFNPDKIKRFRIKEDVYFDRQRGKVETRIIALAPMMPIRTSADLAGNLAYTPAFWLYFPQLRYSLVTQEVGGDDHDSYTITLDDVFMQHNFSAQVVREATPSGFQSGQLEPGSPEAIKIEQKIAELKKNIWRNPRGVDNKKLEQESDRQLAAKRKENSNHEQTTKSNQ